MAEWTECLAIDCKIVAAPLNGRWRQQLARVSVVNEFDQCIYSTYVKPSNGVVNVFHKVTKAPMDLAFQNKVAKGREYSTVRREVKNMIEDCILIGHAYEKDLRILRLRHPSMDKRDAADYFADEDDERPALRDLVADYLDMTLKDGPHDTTQAAVACMRLYKMYESEWDQYIEDNDEEEDSSSDSSYIFKRY